jgi:DNA-binding cell septation regulator SpoVG
LWCASKNTSTSWVLISGVKRKEAYMSQVKTKQKTNRKEVKTMIEVARVYKVEKEESSLKAFVDIKVSDVVLIKGIRVLAKKDGGLFAAMPSNLAGDGKYYETVKFLTAEGNKELQEVVLAAYEA